MKKKNGFTIIEVVLVLAIAGLIFLMVFIALPALQRNQRDTQRKNDISRLQGALQNYQSNNRGKLPSSDVGKVNGSAEADEVDGNAEWAKFYKRYLLVSAAGATDTFEDPDGEPYSLDVMECGKGGEGSESECAKQLVDKTWDGLIEEGEGHTVWIVLNAVCQGELMVSSSGGRKVAMAYKLEGGGVSCVNN